MRITAKAAILEYARSLPFEVVTDYKAGWYMENFAFPELIEMFGGFPTTPDSEGYLTMHYPPWGSDEPGKHLCYTKHPLSLKY